MIFLLFFLLNFFLTIESKVLIITHSFNRPDFIELHVKTFKKFLQDDYEYVVFNDAPSSHMKKEIKKTCERLGVKCFRVPQEMHAVPGRTSPGHRHMDGIQYALNTIGYDFNGIVALVDSDCFLLKKFSFEKYLSGYDIAGKLEGRLNQSIRVRHLSPVLVMMNMNTLPQKRTLTFEGGYIEGLACDVGAHTYYYLKNNKAMLRPLFFNMMRMFSVDITSSGDYVKKSDICSHCINRTCQACVYNLMDRGFDDTLIKFIQMCPDDNIEFIMNNTFMHYRCGSNWDNKPAEYHNAKKAALDMLMHSILG